MVISIKNFRGTLAKFIIDEERLRIAVSVSFENDKPRRAASLMPRKILAAPQCLHTISYITMTQN